MHLSLYIPVLLVSIALVRGSSPVKSDSRIDLRREGSRVLALSEVLQKAVIDRWPLPEIKHLLNQGAKPSQWLRDSNVSAIHTAVILSELEMFDLFLEHEPELISTKDPAGNSLLLYAANEGNVKFFTHVLNKVSPGEEERQSVLDALPHAIQYNPYHTDSYHQIHEILTKKE